MYGTFGRLMLADTSGGNQLGKLVACIGDFSSHGGTIILTNQVDDKLTAQDELVALETETEAIAQHSCPIEGHGITPVTPVTTKSFHNDKLILTEMAIAGCGARIAPKYRKTFVE